MNPASTEPRAVQSAASSPLMMVSRLAVNRSSLLSVQTDSPRSTSVGKRSAGRDRRNAWSRMRVAGSRTRCSLTEAGLLSANPSV
jgi:hypothetical protein